MAGLKQVPVVVWKNGSHKRFERQVVENMHQHQLSDRDRENAIVKLWKTKDESGNPIYADFAQLGKAVGLSRWTIADMLEANDFKESVGGLPPNVSTASIKETRGLTPEKRTQILTALSEGKIAAGDIRSVKDVAKTSDALLDKVLENKIPLQRATEAAETMQKIADQGVALTNDQKQNLADKVAEDETLLDKYKSAVLEKVRQVATTPKQGPRIIEPIGRTSPVQKIIAVKDEVLDHFRVYLGTCTQNERKWAKRTMIDIRDELSLLIEMIHDE